jgi:hypothetical protein
MALKIIRSHCPTCKTKIGLRLLFVPDEILRCPKCGQLLVDSGKRNLLGILLFFVGFLSIVGLQHFYGPYLIRDLVILIVSLLAYGMVRKLNVTKKDYIIRNMDTNRISYIDQADWNEIVENNKGKEFRFEIIEKL